MKKNILILTLLWATIGFAQMVNPVKWTSNLEKVSDSTYNLVFKATIEKGWHVYSQHTPEGGSLPIEIISEQADKDFVFNGKAAESPTEKAFNETFGVEEVFFSHNLMLKQPITILNKDVKTIEIILYAQACEEACIQLEENFIFDLSTASTTIEPIPTEVATANIAVSDEKSTDGSTNLWMLFFLSFLGGLAALLTPCVFPMIPMTVSYFLKQSKNKAKGISNAIFYGISIVVIYVLIGSFVTVIFGADAMNEFSTGLVFNLLFFVILMVFAFSFLGAFEIMLPSSWGTKVDEGIDKKGGYIGIFLMALALAIVSFSCTLPIVGTALAASASSGGIAPIISMLGFSIALALPFTLFAAFPGWLNTLPKSGGWLNTVKVFLGFLELAFAFKFLSNADLVYDLHWFEREIFIVIWVAVALTMTVYLFGFIKLPHDDAKPKLSLGRKLLGGLMLLVTVYLIPGLWGAPLNLISGFPPPLKYAESPYGLSFSNFFPDGMMGKYILIFVLTLGLLVALYFIYKFNKLKLKQENRISVSRLMFGLIVLSLIFYIVPGLWGAPLDKLPLPKKYQTVDVRDTIALPEGAHLGPHDIISFDDYDLGVAYAKKVNKPLLVDFTGKACVNCRKMEDYVWSDPKVMKLLKNEVVLVSLYVDYKKELPESEQFVSEETGKKIRTIGNKWSEFQTVKYKTNTQPYYVLLNNNEETLNRSYTYDSNIDNFYNWLKEGIEKY